MFNLFSGVGVFSLAFALAVLFQESAVGQPALSEPAHAASRRDGGELPRATPESVGMSSAKLAEIGQVAQRLIAKEEYPGATIVVVRRGRIVLLDSYGLADLEASKPMRNDSIYRIYSMGKPIASVAAMMLIEEGLLGLDDPVAQHLPEFADLKVFVRESEEGLELAELERPMTVRDLLRHTAGLTYGGNSGNGSPVSKRYDELGILLDAQADTLDETVAKLSRIPLMQQPGTRFQYGAATDVLGAVLQRVSGQPLPDLLRERVFEPLGMRDTGFHVPPAATHRLVSNYAPTEGEPGLRVLDSASDSLYLKPPKLCAPGQGMVSTARDYARFCAMLLNRGELHGVRLLKTATIEAMTRNQLPESANSIPYWIKSSGRGFGFGFSVVEKKTSHTGQSAVGECGWGGAACTDFWISPQHDLAVIVLSQRMPCSASLRQAIKPIVYGAIESN